ncbi:helix-turn-helix domain-containing protein [Sorangium sp. So ce118]
MSEIEKSVRPHIEAMAAVILETGGDQLEAARAVWMAIEEALVRTALEAASWSLTGAAARLGVSPSTAMRAVRRHTALDEERMRKGPEPVAQRKTTRRD